jgi:hypothetical protein
MRRRQTPQVNKRRKPPVKRRKPASSSAPAAVTAIAWYLQADWPRAKALFPDARELPDTYFAWLQSAKEVVKAVKSAGGVPRPFTIDLDDFLVWCAVQGRQRAAQDRTDYVTEKLRLESQK